MSVDRPPDITLSWRARPGHRASREFMQVWGSVREIINDLVREIERQGAEIDGLKREVEELRVAAVDGGAYIRRVIQSRDATGHRAGERG